MLDLDGDVKNYEQEKITDWKIRNDNGEMKNRQLQLSKLSKKMLLLPQMNYSGDYSDLQLYSISNSLLNAKMLKE